MVLRDPAALFLDVVSQKSVHISEVIVSQYIVIASAQWCLCANNLCNHCHVTHARVRGLTDWTVRALPRVDQRLGPPRVDSVYMRSLSVQSARALLSSLPRRCEVIGALLHHVT